MTKVVNEPSRKPTLVTAFVKSRLKRLTRCDDVWEADFQALPKPIMQNETHYLGMVVADQDVSLLADLPVHGRPTVNDLATLLADSQVHGKPSVNDLATVLSYAMRRPLDGDAHQSKVVSLRYPRRLWKPSRLARWQAGRGMTYFLNNRIVTRTDESSMAFRACGSPARR